MEKKLPKVFANKIEKDIMNNATYFKGNRKIEAEEKVNLNVRSKINQIFGSTRYVYKADVIIELKDRTITKRVIGKNKINLITIDNELIPIKDIIDIKFSD